MNYRFTVAVLMTATMAGVGLSCSDREETVQVTERRVVEAPETEATAPQAGSTLERMGFSEKATAPTPAPSYQWQAPASWTAQPASEFRLANFTLGPNNEGECYLSVLPGDAGGAAANINRWRNQMGLGPLSAEELQTLPMVKMMGQDALLLDVTGAYSGMSGDETKSDYQMLAALLQTPTEMVFTKMIGPQSVVTEQKDSFVAFCASIEKTGAGEASELPAGHPPLEGTADSELPPGHPPLDGGSMAQETQTPSAGIEWNVPEGWVAAPAKPMRLVTVKPAPDSEAECYVTLLTGTGGGIAPNFNRWRTQLGLEALSEEEIQALPKINVLGSEAPFISARGPFQGMTGPAQEDYMLLGTAVLLPEQAVFVKMTGPAAVVEGEQDKFVAFCESLQQP
jgi:hypothetical protein